MGGGTSLLLGKPLPSTIEERMAEAFKERLKSSGHSTHKTFQRIILKFPKIDESFQAVKTVFEKFDKDGSGVMHLKELKNCLGELHVDITDKELKEFYAESDFDHDHGIDFKEFIVFLALIYFLAAPSEDSSKGEVPSRLGLPQLEASFETIVDAFASLDTNGDGYLSKEELIESMNESSSGRMTDRTGITRFEEMDWDNNGLVTFKEFIFSFIDWVRVEEDEDSDDDDGGSSSRIHAG